LATPSNRLAFTVVLAGGEIDRRNSRQLGDLPSVELPQFWQLSDEGADRHWPESFDGLHDFDFWFGRCIFSNAFHNQFF